MENKHWHKKVLAQKGRRLEASVYSFQRKKFLEGVDKWIGEQEFVDLLSEWIDRDYNEDLLVSLIYSDGKKFMADKVNAGAVLFTYRYALITRGMLFGEIEHEEGLEMINALVREFGQILVMHTTDSVIKSLDVFLTEVFDLPSLVQVLEEKGLFGSSWTD